MLYVLSPLVFNIVQEVLARAIRQEKEIKVTQMGKEGAGLSFFSDDRITYVKNLMECIKGRLELINMYIARLQDIRSA